MTDKIEANTQPLPTAEELNQIPMPAGVDRRTFLMRSALLGATTVLTGKAISAEEAAKRATACPWTAGASRRSRRGHRS